MRHLCESNLPPAITGGLRLVTLDKDFRNYESAGLDLLLLKA